MLLLVAIFGSLVTKTKPFVFPNNVEYVFYVPDLAKKN
jgi:hypothetical protein